MRRHDGVDLSDSFAVDPVEQAFCRRDADSDGRWLLAANDRNKKIERRWRVVFQPSWEGGSGHVPTLTVWRLCGKCVATV